MKSSVEVQGSEIVIRIHAPDAAGGTASLDRLIRVEQETLAREGLELGGIVAKIDAGELPVVKIGRGRYVRLSDLLALPKAESVTKVRKAKPAEELETGYADLAKRARGKR